MFFLLGGSTWEGEMEPEAEWPAEPEGEAGREPAGSRDGPGEPAGGEGPANAAGEDGRIVPSRNREAQIRRTGERKLFDEAAKKEFLEWFAATCNAGWAAERAGFNYKTVWRHRMNDPGFAEEFDRAEEQALARLRAKRLETKRRPLKIGIEGDWDAPEMDDIDPILASTLLREHDGKAGRPRKTGRVPRVASSAEVRAALVRRLAAFGIRVWGEPSSPSASAAGTAAGPVPGTEETSYVPGTREGLVPGTKETSYVPGTREPPSSLAGDDGEGTEAPGPLHPRAARGGSPPRPGEEL